MSQFQYFDYKGFGERARVHTHYAQAVRIGDFIETSGQGGIDRETEAFPSSLREEISQAFDNVQTALQAAGSRGFEDVFKVTAYVTGLKEEHLPLFVENLRTHFPEHQPLFTLIGVERLALDGMRVEVEVKGYVKG